MPRRLLVFFGLVWIAACAPAGTGGGAFDWDGLAGGDGVNLPDVAILDAAPDAAAPDAAVPDVAAQDTAKAAADATAPAPDVCPECCTSAAACDDQDPCTKDSCDTASGQCGHEALTGCTGCSASQPCPSGICNPASHLCVECLSASDCPASGNPCMTVGCSAAKTCQQLPNDKPCDDGNPCTVNDACVSGSCKGGSGGCDDGNACTADSCNGGCMHSYLSGPCDDGDACTTGETCMSGGCMAGGQKSCDDGKPCTVDVCDNKTGGCVNDAPAAEGKGCSSGNKCTQGDSCKGGTCVAGPAASCDDANVCTNDSCSAASGCQHAGVPAGLSCGPGKMCDGNGKCASPAGMAFVDAGTFWMGCNSKLDTGCNLNESPQHKVTLSAFFIDLSEVSVAQYGDCVSAGVCTAPSCSSTQSTWPGLMDHPVNCVNWVQARSYCQWRGPGYDLPTEAQWEMAARGTCEKNGSTASDATCKTVMRVYPWGNAAASCAMAVMSSGGADACGTGAAWAVGSKKAGDSPYGIHDMAGNVAEWTRDWELPFSTAALSDPDLSSGTHQNRMTKGGGYGSLVVPYLRASGRMSAGPVYGAAPQIGVRCVRSYP